MTHIMIAGGGIAGLTAALALHTAGFERITVVETVRELRPVGAGLNTCPTRCGNSTRSGRWTGWRVLVRTRGLRYYHRSGGLHLPRTARPGRRLPLAPALHPARRTPACARRARYAPGSGPARSSAASRSPVSNACRRPPGSSSRPVTAPGAASVPRTRRPHRSRRHPLHGARRAQPGRGRAAVERHARLARRLVDAAHQTGTFMFIAGDDRQKAVVYPMTEPDRDSGEVLVNWALAMPADSAGDATRETGTGRSPSRSSCTATRAGTSTASASPGAPGRRRRLRVPDGGPRSAGALVRRPYDADRRRDHGPALQGSAVPAHGCWRAAQQPGHLGDAEHHSLQNSKPHSYLGWVSD